MSEGTDSFREFPIHRVEEVRRPDDDRLVQLRVLTEGFLTTIVVTGTSVSPGSEHYMGYEGNALTNPDEAPGDEALVSIRTGLGRRFSIGPEIGSLIFIPRPNLGVK